MKALADVLEYKNEEVVYRFSEDFGVSTEDAQSIFEETLKWLWLCAYQSKESEAGRSEFVDVPLLGEFFVIDLMWHNFLLFTQDYSEFCESYLAEFIHHIPQKKSDKEHWAKRFAADPASVRAEREQLVYKAYEVIYDVLGEVTLLRWTEEFPAKYKSLTRIG